MTLVARHGALTDIGLHRKTNEDTFVVQPPLYAVCDGMGGANAGEVASGLAAETLAAEVAEGTPLLAAAEAANAAVFQRAHDNLEQTGMGTTLTAFVLEGDTARFVAHRRQPRLPAARRRAAAGQRRPLARRRDGARRPPDRRRGGRPPAPQHPEPRPGHRAAGAHRRVHRGPAARRRAAALQRRPQRPGAGRRHPRRAHAQRPAGRRRAPDPGGSARGRAGQHHRRRRAPRRGPHGAAEDETTLVQRVDPEDDVATGELPFVVAADEPSRGPEGDAADALAAEAAALRAERAGRALDGAVTDVAAAAARPPPPLRAPPRASSRRCWRCSWWRSPPAPSSSAPCSSSASTTAAGHLQRPAGQARPAPAARRVPAQRRDLRLALAVGAHARRRAAAARPRVDAMALSERWGCGREPAQHRARVPRARRRREHDGLRVRLRGPLPRDQPRLHHLRAGLRRHLRAAAPARALLPAAGRPVPAAHHGAAGRHRPHRDLPHQAVAGAHPGAVAAGRRRALRPHGARRARPHEARPLPLPHRRRGARAAGGHHRRWAPPSTAPSCGSTRSASPSSRPSSPSWPS